MNWEGLLFHILTYFFGIKKELECNFRQCAFFWKQIFKKCPKNGLFSPKGLLGLIPKEFFGTVKLRFFQKRFFKRLKYFCGVCFEWGADFYRSLFVLWKGSRKRPNQKPPIPLPLRQRLTHREKRSRFGSVCIGFFLRKRRYQGFKETSAFFMTCRRSKIRNRICIPRIKGN